MICWECREKATRKVPPILQSDKSVRIAIPYCEYHYAEWLINRLDTIVLKQKTKKFAFKLSKTLKERIK